MADYEVGDTIRVKATFRDWAPEGQQGSLTTPASVEVNLYRDDESPLQTALTPTNESLGVYFYDWTLPTEAGAYYIEFKGLINGKPQLSRMKVKAKWDVK